MNEALLKPLTHRTYLGNLAYPSGHTAAMFALAATVTMLLVVPPRPGKAKPLCVLIPEAAGALGLVVAIAVMGLRWHYFTDKLVGAAEGIGTICGLVLILDLSVGHLRLLRANRRLPDPRRAVPGLGLSRSSMELRSPGRECRPLPPSCSRGR